MKKLFFVLMSLLSLEATAIPLRLVNRSLKPIKLVIPGVMNPNLFPLSSSGCGLQPGQVIFFNYKGREQVLLTIEEKMSGRKLVVNRLLRERKKELKGK